MMTTWEAMAVMEQLMAAVEAGEVEERSAGEWGDTWQRAYDRNRSEVGLNHEEAAEAAELEVSYTRARITN